MRQQKSKLVGRGNRIEKRLRKLKRKKIRQQPRFKPTRKERSVENKSRKTQPNNRTKKNDI